MVSKGGSEDFWGGDEHIFQILFTHNTLKTKDLSLKPSDLFNFLIILFNSCKSIDNCL